MSYIIVVVLVIFGLAGIRIADQYVRGVVFRLGRYHATKGPGVYWIIPLIEWQRRVDLRINTAAVEQQETITKDNVPIKVNAVVWYRIVNPMASVLEVKSIDTAVIQVALTTLRTGIGQHSLDEVLKEQEAVAKVIQGKIDAVTEPWGVKVERVEMKNVEIPQSMQRVMAQEAEGFAREARPHHQGTSGVRSGRAAAQGFRDHHAESGRTRVAAHADDHRSRRRAEHHDHHHDAERVRRHGEEHRRPRQAVVAVSSYSLTDQAVPAARPWP
jgi:regulator of protease activity HflC (stomatin/prohibitin superfamily)